MKKHLTVLGLAMAFGGLVIAQGTMPHNVAATSAYQQDTSMRDTSMRKHKMKGDKMKKKDKDWKKKDTTMKYK
ncbi:MAG TPA: hypothetical protein VIM87_13140 [Chitinophaga sp.]|uniref:hypothetical protein n=1 Tax=Chitinophaga sp. TaxID=1869181 RepID=UPI002F9269A4